MSSPIAELQKQVTLLLGYIRKLSSSQGGLSLTYDQWVTKYGAAELTKAGL